MANKLPYHPKVGEVLWCDYKGLVPPEMAKKRLVVALSPKFLNRSDLCTVVPLSTTPPKVVEGYHVRLNRDPHPEGSGADVWVMCDMIMTVSFARLSSYWRGHEADGKRRFVFLRVSSKELGDIKHGVLKGLGMGGLWKPS